MAGLFAFSSDSDEATRRRGLHTRPMPEGLSPSEVGKEIAEHKERHDEHAGDGHRDHAVRERWLTILEAVLLSLVALIAAWSGYSAAKWSTEASITLAKASGSRAQANRNDIEALQIATLDAVRFNAAFAAYATKDKQLYELAVNRFRPEYREAFDAWIASRPLKNPDAAPDPSSLPEYRIPEREAAKAFDSKAEELFAEGQSDAATADKYVRLTVILAAVLFLIGISSHFPIRVARFGLVGVASVLFIISIVQLLGLPGPPS